MDTVDETADSSGRRFTPPVPRHCEERSNPVAPPLHRLSCRPDAAASQGQRRFNQRCRRHG
ncbi:MAG: hypothetical protein LBR18_09440 [Tannerella sp.]|nr:hypothetical protein [Tannerella sp.]